MNSEIREISKLLKIHLGVCEEFLHFFNAMTSVRFLGGMLHEGD